MAKRVYATLLIFSLLLLSINLFSTAHADRCIIPGSEADIYNPGQKAIVAWDGGVEYLILSTDLYSSKSGAVVEILPLPSKPDIKKGSPEAFKEIQRIIFSHSPPALGKAKELELVFHEKIGAHDITVVKAESDVVLLEFLKEYALKHGLGGLRLDSRIKDIIRDYLGRGLSYWVLDRVELEKEVRSIEPIIYRFVSDKLYYPLKVSTAASGETRITLYLITPWKISEEGLPSGFRIARYLRTKELQRLSFPLSPEELKRIDPEISELFKGPAYLTAIIYQGSLQNLEEDLEIGGRLCRSITVRTDKLRYGLGEPVKIVVDFVHLAPGCFEIQVLHHHEIRVQIIGEGGEIEKEWRWTTNRDLVKTIIWRPEAEGTYIIRASSWFNGKRLEVRDEQVIEVSDGFKGGRGSEQIIYMTYGAVLAASLIVVGVFLGYLLARHQGGKDLPKGSRQAPRRRTKY